MAHKYNVTIAKTSDEIEAIRATWASWQYHPNADIDHFLTIVKARDEVICPYVTIIYEDDKLRALVVGRIEDVKLRVSLGYKTILQPTLRHLTIVYGGILGDITSSVVKEIIGSLQKCLNDREAEVICFSNLNIESELFSIARTYPTFVSRDNAVRCNLHWTIELPNTYEEFFSKLSRRTRSSLNNYANRLEKTFSDKLEMKVYEESNDLDRIVNDMEHVARRTYHRGLGTGFIDNNENRVRFELGLKNHWFYVFILYIEGEPIAFWSGWKYRNTFYTDFTGYLPEYSNLRVGNYVLQKMIRSVLSDPSTRKIDFGFGDAQYKQILSNQKWEEASVYVFFPSIGNICLNLLRTFVFLLSKFVNQILNKSSIRNRIKKIWRKKISYPND